MRESEGKVYIGSEIMNDRIFISDYHSKFLIKNLNMHWKILIIKGSYNIV